jgi:hypothetical protein
MHGANFHGTHQVVWQIEGGLHVAIFPESWLSVNALALRQLSGKLLMQKRADN